MRYRITLSDEVLEVLSWFGDLSTVVNKILEAGEECVFDIENCPSYEEYGKQHRVFVNVTNQNYLELVERYGVRSHRASLRRIINYFVNNEVYNDLGWEIVNRNKDIERLYKQIELAQKHVNGLIHELKRQERYELVMDCCVVHDMLTKVKDDIKRDDEREDTHFEKLAAK